MRPTELGGRTLRQDALNSFLMDASYWRSAASALPYVWEIQIGGNANDRIGFSGVTPVPQPSGADQAAVTLGNTDGEIAGLRFP